MVKKNIPKFLIILSFFMIFIIACNNSVEPYNYERDTPTWLKVKIDSISTIQFYYGSKVYRHTWHSNYTYHIFISISSCIYCEVYNANGDKIKFSDTNMAEDYVKNRKNEVLIWEWKD